MSLVNKCVLCWVALVSACDPGAMLNDGDMGHMGNCPPSSNIDMAETVALATFSCTPGLNGGSGITALTFDTRSVSAPSLDYDLTSNCINKGATGYSKQELNCQIMTNRDSTTFMSSKKFTLSFDEKSVTPKASASNNNPGDFQSVHSSVDTQTDAITQNLNSASADNFVERKIIWHEAPKSFNVNFTAAVSCLRAGTNPPNPLNGMTLSVHWEIKNFQLTLSP